MPSKLQKGKQKDEPVRSFRPPRLALDLALGRRHDRWYLLFARHYSPADSREVVRLDFKSTSLDALNQFANPNMPSTSTPLKFWLDKSAVTGWEKDGETLLDLLLSVTPNTPIIRFNKSVPEQHTRCLQVQILIPEGQLAHYCEECKMWESVTERVRWIPKKNSRKLKGPLYVCPKVCFFLSCRTQTLYLLAAQCYDHAGAFRRALCI